MKIKSGICPLIATAIAGTILSGCAGPARDAVIKRIDLREAKRTREAQSTIPHFLGKYRVVDSRGNSDKIIAAELVLLAGVPTLRLWRSGGSEPAGELQANECAGDISNAFSGNMYMACFGVNPHRSRAPYFTISQVIQPQVEKSGSLIPRYEAMSVTSGYVIVYELGRPYESRTSLAVTKEGDIK